MEDRQTLLQILQENKDTDYGRKYGFADIKDYDGFVRSVPLTVYDDYAPYISLMTRLGEVNIISKDKPLGYALAFGSFGAPKYVPYTAAHLTPYAQALASLKGVTFTLFESLPQKKPNADGTYVDLMAGAMLRANKKRFRTGSYELVFKPAALSSPSDVLFPKSWGDHQQERLLYALRERDLTQIVATNAWAVLDTLHYLKANAASFIGKIGGEAENEIADVLREPFTPQSLSKIWPKLKAIYAPSTGPFSIYKKQLREYTDLPIHNWIYAEPEALIGYEAADDAYTLAVDTAFLEFLDEEGCAHTSEELVSGCYYRLVVTNRAGFYRYCTEDVILAGEGGSITYSHRASQNVQLLDLTLTEADIGKAIEDIPFKVEDFVYWLRDGQLVVLVEADEAGQTAQYIEEITDLFDVHLRLRSPGYRAARRSDAVPKPKLLFITPGTQLLYRDLRAYRAQTPADQIKPIRLLDTPDKERFFFKMMNPEVHTTEEIAGYREIIL
jgi:hypothetical protein